MGKITLIKHAIENAIARKSKITEASMNVPALASLRIRHLLCNLGEISTRYLEVGVHRGGSFCSTVCENKLLSATAVDSFASDEVFTNDTVEPDFMKYSKELLHPQTKFEMLKGDAFGVDVSKVIGPIDLYLYDAGHSFEDQKNALLYYRDAMADEFIYCCDDWTYDRVKEGTLEGLKEGDYDILYQRELINDGPDLDNHDNEQWWRGYYIALLKKK